VPNNSYLTSTSAATTVTIAGIDPDTSTQTFLTGGSNASYIYSGDFNNDGYVDLAVYDSVLHTLQIFLGSSSGTFTAGVSLATTVYSSWTLDGGYWMVADINRDGNLDLVNGYTGQVFLGNGNGTFSAGSTLPSTVCQGYDGSAYQAAIADVNGDGKPDIVITCAEYSIVYTLLGSGTGTFSTGPTTNFSAPLVNPGIGGFALADFNGDGKPDLFIVGYKGTSNSPNAITALGTGSSTFTKSGSTFSDVVSNAPVSVGDFRNVGYPDVIVSAEGTYGFLLNNGTSIASYGNAVSYGVSPALIADFNGDGNLDYVSLGADAAHGLAGKGNDTFASATSFSISPAPGPSGATAGDFYNNGRPAIAVTAGLSPSYVEIFPMLKTTPPVTVSCSPNPTTFGNSSTTCTAETTAGATGTMSILYDGNAWGSGNVNASGAFSVSGFSGWGPGSHTIVGNYGGDENYTPSSGSTTYTIGQGETVTQITNSTPNPSTYGSPVTFSVAVNGNGATPSPTGSVTFFNGSTNLGSASVTATASTTNLAPYSQQLLMSPWSGYCGATSNVTLNTSDLNAPDGTETATKFVMPSSFSCGSGVSWGVVDSIVGGLVAGQSYTTSVWLRGANGGEVVAVGVDDCNVTNFTLTTSWQRYSATVPSYASCEPTRGFQMLSNSANATYYAWGAQTEASSSVGPYVATYGASSASGAGAVATFSTASIPAGAQAITAVYNGDSNWLGSTSAAVTQNVTPAVLTVTANNASRVYGAGNPAFTASYSGFQNGDTAAVLSGSPSFTTTATASSPVGAYPITPAAGSLSAANYTFVFANGSLTITPSALNVTANNASRTFDVANPAFTATYIGFVNGDTSASLTTQPTCTTTAVLLSPVGTYPITCSGAVDANYTVTYTAGTLTIGKVTLVPMTSFTFTSSLNPSTYGAGVTFTGTIPAAATGTMQFLDNGIAMGSPVAVSAGVATYTTAALPVGTQTITAQYSGDSNYNAATSPAVSQVVNTAILTVTANNASKVYGMANPSFTPSYSGFVNGDTSAVLSGSPTLTTVATASSPVGTYPITAAVGTLSAANYTFVFTNGTLSITKATSTLSVSSTINPSTYGQTITFTLTVAGSGSGVTPTGTVTLTEGGTTLLGTTTLNGSGTATYTTSSLPVGVDTLQLNYSGDSNYY